MKRSGLVVSLLGLLAAPAQAQPDAAPPEPAADPTSASPVPLPVPDLEATAAPPAPSPVEAEAPDTATAAATDEAPAAVSISGYLWPQIGASYRGAAVPRDRWWYGADATRAGLILSGDPIEQWSYELHVVVSGETVDLISDLSVVDENGDGSPDDVAATSSQVTGLFVERAVVTYQPLPWLDITAGQMRVPFTAQEESPTTSLMFPARSGPNEVFVQGPDLGVLATGAFLDRRLTFKVGAYNGTGAPAGTADERGLVYALRVEAAPLGELAPGEGDPSRGPLRLVLGAGVLYYPARIYDEAGYPGSRIRDLRASLSVRAAIRGFYLQSELLRRQRTDSLSSRPEITTGAYAQSSYLLAVGAEAGLAPIARVGWAGQDQGFDPRDTLWLEAGLAFYPKLASPTAMRVVAQYLGEHRMTESETAHGAVLQLQLEF